MTVNEGQIALNAKRVVLLHNSSRGWTLGNLVARSCYKGKPGRSGQTGPMDPNSKVTLAEFSRLTGIGSKTLQRYYAAYELAATDPLPGIPAVRHPDTLAPSDDDAQSISELVECEDADERVSELDKLWSRYMSRVRSNETKAEKRNAPKDVEKQQDSTPEPVIDAPVTNTPKQRLASLEPVRNGILDYCEVIESDPTLLQDESKRLEAKEIAELLYEQAERIMQLLSKEVVAE